MRSAAPLLAAACCVGAAASAQPPAAAPATGVVVGSVYDSLSGGPLRGAEVRLDGTEHTAVTDAAGAFRLAGVRAGEYVLAFDHPAFDSLGVGLPYGRVHVAAGDTVAVALATPGVAAIARGLCAGLGTDTAGVLLGAVRRADAAGGVAGARVSARWTEWVPAGTTLRKDARELAATADASGNYRLCGVPNDVAVQLTAVPPAGAGVADVRTGTTVVDLHGRVVTLRDVAVRLFAADSAGGATAPAAGDRAALVLTVIDEAGQPVAGAQLRAAGRDAPVGVSDSLGVLRAAGLPAGSQSFQLLALGHAPATVSADLRTGATTSNRVRVGPRVAAQLATVRVVGRAGAFDRTGFEERRRTGQGHYLTADQIRARQPMYFSQLALDQLGFEVVPKPYGGGYAIRSRRSGSINTTCAVQFFVDGAPIGSPAPTTAGGVPAAGLGNAPDIDDVVNPNNVRAVEFYPGIGTVPGQFNLGSRNACGTIVIWTGRDDRTAAPAAQASRP